MLRIILRLANKSANSPFQTGTEKESREGAAPPRSLAPDYFTASAPPAGFSQATDGLPLDFLRQHQTAVPSEPAALLPEQLQHHISA